MIPDDPGRCGAVAVVMRDERMLVIRRSRYVVAPRRTAKLHESGGRTFLSGGNGGQECLSS
jgi:hypothetical protein